MRIIEGISEAGRGGLRDEVALDLGTTFVFQAAQLLQSYSSATVVMPKLQAEVVDGANNLQAVEPVRDVADRPQSDLDFIKPEAARMTSTFE